MKNGIGPSICNYFNGWSLKSSVLTFVSLFLLFTGIFSCKKTGPAEALVSIRDTNGKAVAGATVVLRQDTVINANTGVQANINEKKTTDSQGNAFFSFQWEAVLNVEVSKGTLTETDYIRLEQSKTVQKTVILK